MKPSTVIATSVAISSLVSIGGSYLVTVNVVSQEIEQKISIVKEEVNQTIEQRINVAKEEIKQTGDQTVTHGGFVVQGGSKVGVVEGNLFK